jgi:hypothetical protein
MPSRLSNMMVSRGRSIDIGHRAVLVVHSIHDIFELLDLSQHNYSDGS